MRGRDVQAIAARAADNMPWTTRGNPFGSDWEVFKTRGKVFLLLTDVKGEPVTILKCEPDYAAALRGSGLGITPGYHMNKRHWITITDGAQVSAGLVEDLVRGSYELVLPKRARRARSIEPD